MAQALADSGARVAVTSRDRVRAEADAAEIGAAAIGVALDVRDTASVTRAVDEVYAAFGGLDLLVNNAGIGMRMVNPRFMTEPRPFYEVSPAGLASSGLASSLAAAGGSLVKGSSAFGGSSG